MELKSYVLVKYKRYRENYFLQKFMSRLEKRISIKEISSGKNSYATIL